MKVIIPPDHGATDRLHEEAGRVVVRPHDYPEDTYPAIWFTFGVWNDTRADLDSATIRVENLPTGRDSYEPFWRYCLWMREGGSWQRISVEAQRIEETAVEVTAPLRSNSSLWLAETIPLPYSHYEALHEAMQIPPASGLVVETLTPGETANARPIHAYRVRREQGAADRNILLLSGQHAVEQSGKLFVEAVLRGYHSGGFARTLLAELLETHNVILAPLANPDGCFDGRMNTNAEGQVMDAPDDDSREMRAMMAMVDEFQPRVMVNCHGWGNEMGEPPYEDVYRWTDEDPLFAWLRAHVPGCSSSGMPHLIADQFRLENCARERCGTECAITELNWSWQLPPGGGERLHPTGQDLVARALQYYAAIAAYCMESGAR